MIWKYCAIKVANDNSSKKLKFFDKDGKHSVSDIEDVHQEIAKLGEDGWELISLSQIMQPDARVYYFKKS